jgi:hypothetical protein
VERRDASAPPIAVPMRLPRDLVDEIDSELGTARGRLHCDRQRIAELEQLRSLTIALSEQLQRPATVFDLVRSSQGRAERERRERLLKRLRNDI